MSIFFSQRNHQALIYEVLQPHYEKNIINHFEKNSQNVEVTVVSRQTIMVFIAPALVKSSNKEGNDFF